MESHYIAKIVIFSSLSTKKFFFQMFTKASKKAKKKEYKAKAEASFVKFKSLVTLPASMCYAKCEQQAIN